MKVVESKVKSYKITELESLDPITIMVEDFDEGSAEVTIKIYGESWTAYWGSMGGNVKEFFTRTNVQYLANCFERGIRADSDVKDTCAMQATFRKKMREYILSERREGYILKEDARKAWDEIDNIDMEAISPEHDHECFGWSVDHWTVESSAWKPLFGGCMDDDYYEGEFSQWLWDNIEFQYEPNHQYNYLCRIVEVVKKVLMEAEDDHDL